MAGAVAAVVAAVSVAGTLVVAGAGRPPAGSAGDGLVAGRVGSRAAVPWRRVGAGWLLAEYWPGQFAYQGKQVAATATLYLIDPAGGRYRLYRWAATKSPPRVVDWSGDKSRALLQSSTGRGLAQLVLATGKVSRVRLPANTQVIGYTMPRGQGLLGWQQASSRERLALYSLNGRRIRVLVTGTDADSAVSSGTGAAVAVPGRGGVRLVSDDSGAIRTLPVPGSGSAECRPWRWWNSATILASCDTGGGRLWLVPASGGRPVPLTPRRGPHSGDPGDIDGWRLPDDLYLQAVGSNGSGRIFRQPPSGPVRSVTVPGRAGNNWIASAYGGRLLLSAQTPCFTSTSLMWFSPSTRHEQILFKPPRGRAGVIGGVPYGQPTASFHTWLACAG